MQYAVPASVGLDDRLDQRRVREREDNIGRGDHSQALINPAYRREVFGALRAADVELLEVFLDVPTDELRRRIEHRVLFDDPVRDADAREFCLSKLKEGVAAADRVDRETLVLQAVTVSPEQLAQAVLDQTAAMH
jgi:hypothetical protein